MKFAAGHRHDARLIPEEFCPKPVHIFSVAFLPQSISYCNNYF